jgi:hypothetical protein
VANRRRRAFDRVRSAEDVLQQHLIVRLAFEIDEGLFDALQKLVYLGQEQRLIVGREIELQLRLSSHVSKTPSSGGIG